MNAGGVSLPVVAAGSVAGNGQIIFISLIDNSEVFRLALSYLRNRSCRRVQVSFGCGGKRVRDDDGKHSSCSKAESVKCSW